SARNSVTCATRPWMAAENSPASERIAERAASRLAASIRSATASACARSSLPFRNARRVNSPGSARRAPASSTARSTSWVTTGPPWPCSSSTASPVYECGAGKYSAMPSSRRSPFASAKTDNVACLAAGSRPSTAAAMRGTAGPETLTMPMPPRPAGVATAATVSRSSPLAMGRFVAVEHPLDLPLLCDGKDVVDQPVQHQSRGEEKEEDAEDERHELHHLRLHRVRRNRIHLGLQDHGDGHQDRQHVVRIERRQVLDPENKRRVPQLDCRQQHPVQRDEHRNLHQD